jgi:putative spermidine/putrescine transport system permease protein
VSAFLQRRPGLRVGLLLTPPMLWLGAAYLAALGALLVTAFWGQNAFTGDVERVFTWQNFHDLLTLDVYRTITLRTLGIALAVTLVDGVLAFPVAFFMAKVASPRSRAALTVAVLMPLWASYLVKAYAWRILLANDGPLDAIVGSPGYGLFAVILVLSYMWLPYMILPIYAGLERLPDSMLEASADLGARPARTFRQVVLPTLVPSVFAGSIFTFSLSLGDYITVQIVGGKTQLIGNLVYANIGAANNLPFAAAIATIPVVIMVVYLIAVRRSGALEKL